MSRGFVVDGVNVARIKWIAGLIGTHGPTRSKNQ